MNLKQLEVFLAVADSGSFSRGAEATFITQSTVSQHIAALEQEFGIRLLDRTGRGALLTEAGKLLAEHARRVVREAREVETALSRFKGVEDVHLRVGGSNIPGSYMIPAALPRLLSRYPGLRLTLVEGGSRAILERLLAEEVEIGVVGSMFDMEGVDFTPLGHDEVRLVVPNGHRWCGRSAVTLDELADEPVIMREVGSGTGQTVADALQRAGLSPARLRVRLVLGSNEAIKQAVGGGVGVAFLSGLSVQGELARGELEEVPVEGVQIARRFYLAARNGRELSPAAAAFGGVIRELYGDG
ncbi:MAG TPA: selenium metabolism-associated LysR family transcriptional regulator [Geobacteraceae bacterium]